MSNSFWRAVVAAGIFGLTSIPAHAFVVDPREISLLLESTLIDIDMAMIDMHYGHQSGNQLIYLSRIDRYSWNGHLYGTHGGRNISVHYSGKLTPLDALGEDYSIAYTSNWLVDGQSGAGFGSGTSIDPWGDVDISLSGGVGGSIGLSYGIASISIAANKDLVNEQFNAGVTVGVATVPILNVSVVSASGNFTYFQATGDYRSTLTAQALGFIPLGSRVVNKGNIISVDPPYPPPPEDEDSPPVTFEDVEGGFIIPDGAPEPYPPGYNIGTTGTDVPEPATWVMLITGFGLVGAALRARQRQEAPSSG